MYIYIRNCYILVIQKFGSTLVPQTRGGVHLHTCIEHSWVHAGYEYMYMELMVMASHSQFSDRIYRNNIILTGKEHPSYF